MRRDGISRQDQLTNFVSLRVAMIAPIVAMQLTLPGQSVVQHLDNKFLAFRAAAAPRDASGQFVFVATDKKSLVDIGIWPWPRDVYAEVIDRLSVAGVRDNSLTSISAHPRVPTAMRAWRKRLRTPAAA